eukprot:9471718-Pyramimonas_sp.AAC.1
MARIVATKSYSALKWRRLFARQVSAVVPRMSFLRAGARSWFGDTRSATCCTVCASPVPMLITVPRTGLW